MDLSALWNIQPPGLYEKMKNLFWEDAHISKGMLAAHLNPNGDAASRNASFMDKSAAWIAQIMPPQTNPVLLDLGCGPGLYAQRFCRAGYWVTGVDISSRSIAYARQSAQQEGLTIFYHCADYMQLDLPMQFDCATLIYCDYGALSTEDRAGLLGRIHAHLRVGGKLLLDVSSEYAFQQFIEWQRWSICAQGGYWSPKPHVALERMQRFCDCVTLQEAHILSEEVVQSYYIWHTYFSPERMQAEANAAGFSLVGCWGDVAGAPYCETSPTLAVLLEKK